MIELPSTIDQAVDQLNGVAGLLTAKQWERAAIVYAFTHRPPAQDRMAETPHSILSYQAFADLGISGLRERHTVASYHDNWQAAVAAGQAKPVKPGDEVELPTRDWPPNPDSESGTQRSFIAQVRRDPTIIPRALDKLSAAERQRAEDVIEDHVASNPASVARVNQEAERRRPTPVRPEPARNGVTAAASLTALEATAARLRDVATEVVADVLAGRAERELLAEPIKSIEVDLDRLRMAAESDHNIDTVPADWTGGAA